MDGSTNGERQLTQIALVYVQPWRDVWTPRNVSVNKLNGLKIRGPIPALEDNASPWRDGPVNRGEKFKRTRLVAYVSGVST